MLNCPPKLCIKMTIALHGGLVGNVLYNFDKLVKP